MSKVTVNEENCKSCRYCVESCPKGALTVSARLNSKGYTVVEVDESRCVGCGVCYTVCPDYVFNVVGKAVE